MARLAAENPEVLDQIFTEREQLYCKSRGRPAEHMAARFAAKEAILKALGTGLGAGANWTDVELVAQPFGGPPEVAFHGAVAGLPAAAELVQIEVSMSHVDSIAMAVALAVWPRSPEEPSALPPDRSN
jgi:holo-[acyl-carrier protein] synthase